VFVTTLNANQFADRIKIVSMAKNASKISANHRALTMHSAVSHKHATEMDFVKLAAEVIKSVVRLKCVSIIAAKIHAIPILVDQMPNVLLNRIKLFVAVKNISNQTQLLTKDVSEYHQVV
jgi:hypothetical protein